MAVIFMEGVLQSEKEVRRILKQLEGLFETVERGHKRYVDYKRMRLCS